MQATVTEDSSLESDWLLQQLVYEQGDFMSASSFHRVVSFVQQKWVFGKNKELHQFLNFKHRSTIVPMIFGSLKRQSLDVVGLQLLINSLILLQPMLLNTTNLLYSEESKGYEVLV